MKFEKAFVAVLETLSVAMTAANSANPVVNFFFGVREDNLKTESFKILTTQFYFLGIFSV
jgi:hypothetical protein